LRELCELGGVENAVFGDARASSLSDLVQGSLMLKFNKAKRKA